jgi:hypothetical protein
MHAASGGPSPVPTLPPGRVERPRPPRRRGSRSLLAAALLALVALVAFDCLELVAPDRSPDLSPAAHHTDVHRAEVTGLHRPAGNDLRRPLGAVVPAALGLIVVGLAWTLTPALSTDLPWRPRVRPRLRAPPGLRFPPARP